MSGTTASQPPDMIVSASDPVNLGVTYINAAPFVIEQIAPNHIIVNAQPRKEKTVDALFDEAAEALGVANRNLELVRRYVMAAEAALERARVARGKE